MLLSLQMSRDALLSLFLFSLFFMTVFSTLLYFSERGLFYPEWHMAAGEGPFTASEATTVLLEASSDPLISESLGRPPINILNSKFEPIPATFWYVLCTMTTVGFGDMVPQSVLGKLLSIPLMYFGILVSPFYTILNLRSGFIFFFSLLRCLLLLSAEILQRHMIY